MPRAKNTGSPPQTPPNKKRKGSVSGGSRKRVKQDIADRQLASTFAPVKQKLIKGSKKVNKGAGKKPMKLNPQFKKAVKQALDSGFLYGRLETHYAGGWNANISENNLGAENLSALLGTIGYGGCFFTPFEIVSVAKTLWADAAFPKTIVKTLPVMSGTPPTGAGSSSFACTVINSYLKVNMTNNSSRTFTVDVYDSAPKIRGQAVANTFNPANASVTSESILQLPLQQWLQRVNDQQNMGQLNADYSTTAWSSSPLEINGMKKEWDYNMTRFIIGPGQKDNFFIQGPKNYGFDWAKQWKNGQYVDLDKFVKNPFVVVRCENLTSSVDNSKHGIPGYQITNTVGDVDPKLEFLGELCYKMKMPEQTLGYIDLTAAAGQIAATKRRGNVFYKKQYYDSGIGNDGITTLPENPIQDKVQA